MTIEEAARAYDNLSREGQIRFLTLLSHYVTISVRGCYDDRPQVVNSHSHSPVGCLNEIQHQISGILGVLLDNKPDPPSGINFIHGLLVWAEYGGVASAIIDDIVRSMRYVVQEWYQP